MRLDIRYRMWFRYDAMVREAHNEIRVRPRDRPEQRLLDHRLTTAPAARVLSFTDYWGTTVDCFGHTAEHDQLEIIAESSVETRPRAPLATAPMEALRDPGFALAHAEMLGPSPHVEWDDDIAALGAEATVGAGDVKEAVAAAVTAARSRLEYRRGSTRIGIPLPELMAGGGGVCQDFAHLTIGLLRAAQIPARYVSGYLFAADETDGGDGDGGGDDDIVEVQTHAWVEAAVPGEGWHPVDPTNDRPVGERHVVIGAGRDYDDVAPVRGVYQGDALPEVVTTVEIRRMEPVERTLTERPRRRGLIQVTAPVPPDPIIGHQQQ